MSINYNEVSDGKTTTISFKVDKPQKRKLDLEIYKSDHANEKFIKLKINNQFFEIYPSELAQYDGTYTPVGNGLIMRGGKGGIWTGDHYEIEYKEKYIILTKDDKIIYKMKIEYPLKVEISGGAMMIERMNINK